MGGPITTWTPIGADGLYEIAHVKTVESVQRDERLQQRACR